jgi:hypothetical protein
MHESPFWQSESLQHASAHTQALPLFIMFAPHVKSHWPLPVHVAVAPAGA